MPSKSKKVIPVAPTDDHVETVRPGPKALALWAAFAEYFPSTCHLAGIIAPPSKPYPRRRIYRVE